MLCLGRDELNCMSERKRKSKSTVRLSWEFLCTVPYCTLIIVGMPVYIPSTAASVEGGGEKK